MMLPNHYELERLMEQRVKDALREAERARLVRAAQAGRGSRRWLQRMAQALATIPSLVRLGVDGPHRSSAKLEVL